MRIAYTMSPGKGDTDLILYSVAQRLAEMGIRAAGTTQINTDRPDAGPCDMDVMVLPSGPTLRISQSLGRAARGCRLDPDALETAVSLVQDRLVGSQCLIVNKFGKHEAEGRGFRMVIADALGLGLPVLVGLNQLNADAFHAFTGEVAEQLAPCPDTIVCWVNRNVLPTQQVA